MLLIEEGSDAAWLVPKFKLDVAGERYVGPEDVRGVEVGPNHADLGVMGGVHHVLGVDHVLSEIADLCQKLSMVV